MDYKVMKRPMFKMGGPTSGGTGITSGLETPRQNFAYSTYGEAIQAIPEAFQKRRTGLENQMGSIGPMALYSAVSGGALENVDSLGDLAQAFGNPAVLQSVMGGLASKNKLQSSLDDVDLKEATTMATLYKPAKGTDFDKKIKRIRELTIESRDLLEQNRNLEISKEGKNDLEIAKIDQIIKTNEEEIDILNKEEKIIISRTKSRQEILQEFQKDFKDENGYAPDEDQERAHLQKNGYFAEGGRINKAIGGEMNMGPATQTTAPGPEMMTQGGEQATGEDPFQILRARLPREIPDDVVSLIAYNQKAFADFANIQDQDDVDLFNQKYNVQLVVDLASR